MDSPAGKPRKVEKMSEWRSRGAIWRTSTVGAVFVMGTSL
jgi:hypothetical protein